MYSKCTVMLAEKMYFNFLYAVVKVTQHMSLHNELSTRFCHIHAGQVYTYRKTVHCPKNALYLSIKTEPVTAGARMQRDMPGFCFNIPYTGTVASAPNVTGSVFMRRFRLFLGQCIQLRKN